MTISGGFLTNTDAKESRITARIIRVDGTVEDLGEIAYWHKNPVRVWLRNFSKKISNLKEKITNAI